MYKLLYSINRYRWILFLIWPFCGLVLWSYAAWEGVTGDPDGPPGLYIFMAILIWLTFHLLPAIVLAILLFLWRRFVRRKKKQKTQQYV